MTLFGVEYATSESVVDWREAPAVPTAAAAAMAAIASK
jgi:hypothetical protein